jgi:biotin carboxyl carrier protein
MRYAITIAGEELLVDVDRAADGRYTTSLVGPAGPEAGRAWEVTASSGSRAFTLVSGERTLDLVLGTLEDGLDVYAGGERFEARIEPARATSGQARPKATHDPGAVRAPMPGKVVKVLVEAGESIEVGNALVVVEAMKMENELFAKAAGRVRTVHVTAGEAVERGAVLISIDPW